MIRKVMLGMMATAIVATAMVATSDQAWARHRRCCGGYGGYYGGGHYGGWNNWNSGYYNTGFYNSGCGQVVANNCCGATGTVGTAQANGTYSTNYAPQGYFDANGQWVNTTNANVNPQNNANAPSPPAETPPAPTPER